MNIVKRTTVFILLLLPIVCSSQEILTGLASNPHIFKESRKKQIDRNGQALRLPFLEDFSGQTGYPNPELWQDRQAFVNTGFAIFPPSTGVATLDAINERGEIYPHASSSPFPADTLTSRPIRLDSNFFYHRRMLPSDSIYFSFYFQPGGGSKTYPSNAWERIGDTPEHSDKLVLEFGYSTGNIVFGGFIYGEYIVEKPYSMGDSIENPFFPGTFYYLDSDVYTGQAIMIPADSIFVEEFVWNEVWSTEGFSLDEWLYENPLQYFKQVMIPITDEQYLRNNFQFRFRNYASLDIDSWNGNTIVGWSSNCDQWNIDYIRLNSGRRHDDVFPYDVAFVSPSTSMLEEYWAMPWRQFRPSDLAEKFYNELCNNSNATQNTYYTYNIVKNRQQEIFTYPANNENAAPYYDGGLHTYPYHAFPDIGAEIVYDGADSALFTVTHTYGMVGVNDECPRNDTCVVEQKFYNYYAYDDGTAEAGYCLLSTMTNPQASFAVKFTLAEPDTLQAVRMWFNRTLDDENVDYFTLMVWDDDGGEPGNVLYELPSQLPGYAREFQDFVTYYLEEPMAVSGTFYVGFFQNHDIQLNIGFDQNSDARGKFFYKTAALWNESFYKGAPMIRAVVGKSFDHSGINHNETENITVYPNPTSDRVFVKSDSPNTRAELFNAFGQILDSGDVGNNGFSLKKLPSGIYFIKIYIDGKFVKTEKIIKR